MGDMAIRARRGRRLGLVGAVGAAVVAVDQATKTWAVDHLADRTIHLVWTLRLNLAFNSGAAFGVGRGYGPYVVAAAVTVLVVFLGLARTTLARNLLLTVALGLVLGGALGNLTDRLLRQNHGAVIDFIDLQWWPVFNVADAAVSAGAVLLVLGSRPGRGRPGEAA